MLWAIFGGQPLCCAAHPSQTVAMASEKHITANQSRALTRPRLSVGSAKAASTAQGTASRLNSGSDALSTNRMKAAGRAANMSGTQICGAAYQPRQRHNANSVNGQTGHKNQGRS